MLLLTRAQLTIVDHYWEPTCILLGLHYFLIIFDISKLCHDMASLHGEYFIAYPTQGLASIFNLSTHILVKSENFFISIFSSIAYLSFIFFSLSEKYVKNTLHQNVHIFHPIYLTL